MHSKFIIFGDNFAKMALKFKKLSRQLLRIWIYVLKLFQNFLENGEFGGQFYQIWPVIGYIILYMAGKDISSSI